MKTTILILGLLGLLAGCQATKAPATGAVGGAARFYLESLSDESGTVVQLPGSDVTLTVLRRPVLTEYDIIAVEVIADDKGAVLRFRFTAEAGLALQRMSVARQSRRLVLLVDGDARGVVGLVAEISDAELVVPVPGETAQLQALVARIQRHSEALPREARR
jgi:hypothetical protein